MPSVKKKNKCRHKVGAYLKDSLSKGIKGISFFTSSRRRKEKNAWKSL